MNLIRTYLLSTLLLVTFLKADCNYQLFNISSTNGTTIEEFVDQLSNSCEFSLIVKSGETQKKLKQKLQNIHIKNLTLTEVLDIILKEYNLYYTLENNLLRISYLQTKTYNIDYILSQRKGVTNTDVTLSSTQAGASSDTGGGSTSGGNAESGVKIESTDEVIFWADLDKELQSVLNRPEDEYKAEEPIINKNAGLITVSATSAQLKRLDSYLHELQTKVQYQVLIDVHMLSVTLNDSQSTGVDWSQLWKLQNMKVDYGSVNNPKGAEWTTPVPLLGTAVAGTASVFQLAGGASLNEVIKFLKTEGDVKAISNPKILTLNNQPALITVGNEYFYKITNTVSTSSSGGSDTFKDEIVNSVFAGILLHITPEISNDGEITLKINPSVSETLDVITSSTTRNMPPDLTRKQLSSVVITKDGNKIVLGGLISRKNSIIENKVPILGDIPILGYAFSSEKKVVQLEELIIIIEPHIIKKDQPFISLSELGYTRLSENDLNATGNMSEKLDEIKLR